MKEEISLKKIERITDSQLRAIGKLRVQAWSVHIPEASQLDEWIDPLDSEAIHWIVERNGILLAAARLTIHESFESLPDRETYEDRLLMSLPKPIASINRLVVSPVARGLGISRLLDHARLEEAAIRSCRCVIGATPSGPERVSQLLNLGFNVVGSSSGYREGPFRFQPTKTEAVVVKILD